MDFDALDQEVREDFTPEVREQLVQTFSQGYENVADYHNPGIGHNSATFGFCVYHCCKFEFAKIASLPDSTVTIFKENPFFLKIGKSLAGFYKVGYSSNDNIWDSFPKNTHGALQLVDYDLTNTYLPGFEKKVELRHNIILSHLGNPEEGLCALYICIPSRVENGHIREWGYADLLWKREAGTIVKPQIVELHQEVPVEQAIVRLRHRKEDDEQQG